ncbi:MAG: hypothetical protein HQL80_03475 [Magnetococcales bacterium]|nr:hypothetical protein [Magnetococcales bacterium]
MSAKEMLSFREELSRQGILFCYSGYITEEVLSSIGNTLKHKLEIDKTDKRVSRGVFSLFVEQVQNLIRYSAEVESSHQSSDQRSIELRYGLLTVGQKEERYFVACANMVPNRDVAHLRANLAKIKEMDSVGLKALYKEILKGETPEGSKGAGVGFVDIARRATNGFEFDFVDVDSEFSYFFLKAYI